MKNRLWIHAKIVNLTRKRHESHTAGFGRI
jgi:hypothetical protein